MVRWMSGKEGYEHREKSERKYFLKTLFASSKQYYWLILNGGIGGCASVVVMCDVRKVNRGMHVIVLWISQYGVDVRTIQSDLVLLTVRTLKVHRLGMYPRDGAGGFTSPILPLRVVVLNDYVSGKDFWTFSICHLLIHVNFIIPWFGMYLIGFTSTNFYWIEIHRCTNYWVMTEILQWISKCHNM